MFTFSHPTSTKGQLFTSRHGPGALGRAAHLAVQRFGPGTAQRGAAGAAGETAAAEQRAAADVAW